MQTAEGLDLCHQQGLFHGLLKPSNLMIGADGQVRILDFGIGCLLAETEGESLVDTMSTANSVNSGLDCSSPESIMDPTNLTAVGDQYSLGCVMYFCLTGQYPFPDGTAVEKMMAHQHKQPKSIQELAPEIPDGLAAVVERLMQKTPAVRYASCAEVIEALRPFAPVSGPVRSRPTMTIPRLKPSASAAPAPKSADAPARATSRPTGPLPPRVPSAAAPKLKPSAPVRPTPAPPTAAVPASKPVLEAAPLGEEPGSTLAPKSLGQRMGALGYVLLALLTGAVAWLVCNLVLPK